jgi:predicted ThiF/HesA family dinucleotide-utilizing enzyme
MLHASRDALRYARIVSVCRMHDASGLQSAVCRLQCQAKDSFILTTLRHVLDMQVIGPLVLDHAVRAGVWHPGCPLN